MSAHADLAAAAVRLKAHARVVGSNPLNVHDGVIPGPWVASGADVESLDGQWDTVAECASADEARLIAAFGPDVADALADVLADAARQLYPSDLLVDLARRINAQGRVPAAVTS
jgi:hypothetical protein